MATDKVSGRDAGADPPLSIFLRFLRFGALAWGGPSAQIEMIREECVDRLGWVSPGTFARSLAVYQLLPGPEAHELCVFLGRTRGGRLGGFLAGLGFMLPGFILMFGLSALYVETGLASSLDDVLYGLKAAVAALLARAISRLGRAFLTDVACWAIAIAALAATLIGNAGFVIVLIAGGIAYEIYSRLAARREGAGSLSPLPLAAGLALTGAVGGTALQPGLGEVFTEGLWAGLLTFGGAYTVIPFLQDAAVSSQGWLTEAEFVDGLALAGALPAPLIIFSTFVGYLAAGPLGGIAMTVGIFLPAFILPIFFHKRLAAIADNEYLHPFLQGVVAAVVGLIAAVTIEILGTSVADIPAAILAVAAFAALTAFHSRVTVVAVVVGCGLIGWVLQTAFA